MPFAVTSTNQQRQWAHSSTDRVVEHEPAVTSTGRVGGAAPASQMANRLAHSAPSLAHMLRCRARGRVGAGVRVSTWARGAQKRVGAGVA